MLCLVVAKRVLVDVFFHFNVVVVVVVVVASVSANGKARIRGRVGLAHDESRA